MVSKRPRLSANLRVPGKRDAQAIQPEPAVPHAGSAEPAVASEATPPAETTAPEPVLSAREEIAVTAEPAPLPTEPVLSEAAPLAEMPAPEPAVPESEWAEVMAEAVPVPAEPAPTVPVPVELPALALRPAGVPVVPETLAEPFSFAASRGAALGDAIPAAAAACGESLGSIVGDATVAMSLASCVGLTHGLVMQFRLSAYMLNALHTASSTVGLMLPGPRAYGRWLADMRA
jgi:hypothetical protein